MKPYYDEAGIVIYHSDCRDVLPALTERAAVTITSPPYWNAREYEGVGWDDYTEYLEFVGTVLGFLAARTDWLIWIASYVWRDGALFDCSGDAARIAQPAGFQWRCQVPWVKSDYAPQPSTDLAPAHELIQLLLSRPDAYSNFDALRVTRRAAERIGRVATERPSGGAQRGGGAGWGHERFDGMKQAPNVLVVPKLNGHERMGHPAAFPEEVVQPWIDACSPSGALVLDPFAGSGTTLRVAKDNGRRAIGIELSERYCEIAAQRLAQEVLDFGPGSREEQ